MWHLISGVRGSKSKPFCGSDGSCEEVHTLSQSHIQICIQIPLASVNVCSTPHARLCRLLRLTAPFLQAITFVCAVFSSLLFSGCCTEFDIFCLFPPAKVHLECSEFGELKTRVNQLPSPTPRSTGHGCRESLGLDNG